MNINEYLMSIESQLSFIATMVFALAALGYLFYFYKREQEFEKKTTTSYEQAKQIIDHANTRASALIEKASKKANDMLTSAQAIREGIQQDANKTLSYALAQDKELLKKQTDEFVAMHQKALHKLHEEYVLQIDTSVANVKESTEKELADFMNILKKETVEAQVFIGEKINKEFDAAKQEIKQYKKAQLTAVDKTIQKMLVKVAEDVLGKAIPMEKHEKLILEALEKAKQQGALTET
ncbi:MAG: hypothetical protein HY429_02765 [Candidatus Levybacteria bacterium]|nr:hypothetical protein [Candidatus Levybacteria bacterium]